MRWRRGLTICGVAAVSAGLLLAAGGASKPAAAAASSTCRRSLSGSTSPTAGQQASARPVVLVHGWTGSPLSGTAAALKSRLGGKISTFTFDYSKWAADWPTNANIAPCLAQYVAQVSAAYLHAGGDGKVILVAHSMGGLAIRYASSAQYTSDPITAAEAPLIISLDTPYLGSPWGATLLAYAKELFGAVLGNSVPNPFGTDGSVCLEPHDAGGQLPARCGGLPPWLPGGTTLDQLGGDITIDRTLLGVHLYDVEMSSDGIVNTESSTGYRTSGPGGSAPFVSSATTGTTMHSQYVDCTVTTGQIRNALNVLGGVLSSLGVPLEELNDYDVLQELQAGQDTPKVMAYSAAALATAGCSHIHITTDAAAMSTVAADISSYLAGHPAPASISSFLGMWGVHDGTLCIGTLLNIDGPGSKIPSTLPCNGSSSWGFTSAWGCNPQTAGLPMVCDQFYTVHFASNANGSITGTIAGNPIYVDTSDEIVPANPNYWQAFKPGETFTLAHAATGLLTVTYPDGSQGYWCNYNAVSAVNRPKCGA